MSSLCGKTITAPTGTCVVNVASSDIDHSTQTTTNADCLTLGEGVTVNFLDDDSEIVCDATPCGKGIHVLDSGGSSDKVEINNPQIVGDWDYGIYATTGDNFVVNEANVDLQGSGGTGIKGSVKEVTKSVVTNGTGDCIDISIGSISDSVARFCDGYGIKTVNAGGGNRTSVAHSVIHHNGRALQWSGELSSEITVDNTVIYENDCLFWVPFYNVCNDGPAGHDIGSHSFIDDVLQD